MSIGNMLQTSCKYILNLGSTATSLTGIHMPSMVVRELSAAAVAFGVGAMGKLNEMVGTVGEESDWLILCSWDGLV